MAKNVKAAKNAKAAKAAKSTKIAKAVKPVVMVTIQYLGKDRTMIAGKFIFEGHVRDVSEKQAEQLMKDAPKEWRIIARLESAADETGEEGMTMVRDLDGSQKADKDDQGKTLVRDLDGSQG